MNKYIKIAIISLTIALITILICIVILLNKPDETIPASRTDALEEGEVIIEHGTIQKVTSRDDFSMVDKCIKEYMYYVYEKDTEVICKLIDKTYMQENQINEQNVLNKIYNFNENQRFTSRKMYYANNMPLQTYFVYGLLQTYSEQTENYDAGIDLYITVNIDSNNLLYSITPDIDRNIFDIQAEEKLKIINNTNVKSIEIGENNVFNTIQYENLEDLTQIRSYIEDYMNLSLSNVELAYELLEPTYKQEKFKEIYEYKTYIQDNIERLENTYITKYSKEEKEDCTIYTCIDNYENTYTITEYNIMDYNISLDAYTVRNEQYKDKYAKLENDKKVVENIKQFIEMINTKSYEQAYKLLDEQFKQANFPTLESYKQYISQTMFENTKAESVTITQEGNIFICNVVIIDKNAEIQQIKNIKIIMQLQEDAKYKMSFSI